MAFFASEISVGLLVDFVSCKMKNVCINSGTSQPPGCRAHCMVFDSERYFFVGASQSFCDPFCVHTFYDAEKLSFYYRKSW